MIDRGADGLLLEPCGTITAPGCGVESLGNPLEPSKEALGAPDGVGLRISQRRRQEAELDKKQHWLDGRNFRQPGTASL